MKVRMLPHKVVIVTFLCRYPSRFLKLLFWVIYVVLLSLFSFFYSFVLLVLSLYISWSCGCCILFFKLVILFVVLCYFISFFLFTICPLQYSHNYVEYVECVVQ